MPFELIVLAAGVGSRFGGDKQIEGFGPGGETLLELNVFDAVEAGVDSIAYVTREDLVPAMARLAEQLPADVGSRVLVQSAKLDPSDAASPERDRPWGTAHAWAAGARDDGPTLVVNADDLYGAEAMQTVARVVGEAVLESPSGRPMACVAGYRVAHTLSPHGGVSRALIATEQEAPADEGIAPVTSLEELADVRRSDDGIIRGVASDGRIVPLDDDALVSLNLWGFCGPWTLLLDHALERFKHGHGVHPNAEFRIPDVVFAGVADGLADVCVAPTRSRWTGVTFPEDRPHVEATLLEEFGSGAYPSPLFPPRPDRAQECS